MTVDMRQAAQYNTMFENLLRHIYGQPAVKRPALGSPPDFPGPVIVPRQTVRLASFAIEHWELESGVVMNEQYPKTFWLPEEAVRRSLKPGDIVKLMFKYIYPHEEEFGGFEAERMWVELMELNGPYFVRRLRNSPVMVEECHDLEFNSQVVFLPEHVIDFEEGGLVAPEDLPKALEALKAKQGDRKRPSGKKGRRPERRP